MFVLCSINVQSATYKLLPFSKELFIKDYEKKKKINKKKKKNKKYKRKL